MRSISMTPQQKNAALQIITVVSEAIRELKEVPSGVLYSQLMGHMSLDQYNQIIGLIKRTGLVTESNHLLKWVGPAAA